MRRDDHTGLLLALCGFALLSLADATVKTIAGQWPPTAVAALRFSIGAIGLAAVLGLREGRAGFAMPLARWQVVRGVSIAMASVSFFAGLFLMPLAEATAISFTSPMWTALLAALLLGEPARRTTWAATVLAFAGVLLILRPNVADLEVAGLLPLLSAFFMGVLLVGNRVTAGSASPIAMQFFMAAIAAPILVGLAILGHASGAAALRVGPLDWSVAARCALVAMTASTGHWLVYLGTERASAGRVAPMTYVQLLVTVALGWIVFGEQPDGPAVAGGAIIVASGLLLWRAGPIVAARRRT